MLYNCTNYIFKGSRVVTEFHFAFGKLVLLNESLIYLVLVNQELVKWRLLNAFLCIYHIIPNYLV